MKIQKSYGKDNSNASADIVVDNSTDDGADNIDSSVDNSANYNIDNNDIEKVFNSKINTQLMIISDINE